MAWEQQREAHIVRIDRRFTTADEHGEAEVAAYYRAEHRGGGRLPPYEPAKAVEDFCWAVNMVIRQIGDGLSARAGVNDGTARAGSRRQ